MNYGKIRTFSKPKPKPKPSRRPVAIIALVSLLIVSVIVARVSALGSDQTSRTKPVVVVKTVKATAQRKTPTVTPVSAPVVATPPVAPLIDPNSCEPERWWRADNYECIDKPKPIVEAPAPVVNAIEAPAAAISPTPVRRVIPTGGSNCEMARALIAQYDWNQQSAYDVMYQESTCNPNATNAGDVHATCNGSYGLFQISCENGVIYDPAANVAQAYKMYQSRGWQPWSYLTCKVVSCY